MKSRRTRLFTFVVFVVLASLDNAAAGVLPPLYAVIARDFATSEAALGGVTAVYILILAVSAVFWGYWGDGRQGDRLGQRKPLLLLGTVVWGTAMCFSGLASDFTHFLWWQMVTAVGVGGISSVGFSVVSDLIPFRRRGLALSLWSVSQGLGAAAGALIASSLGAYNWRLPFFLIAGAGFFFAFLYLFTHEPERGVREPELAPLFAAGGVYKYRISLADLRSIFDRRSTAWLMAQSFFVSLAYGSTVWIPRWAIARVQAEGYTLEVATIVGNLFVALFSVGGFFAIPAGHLGDLWQRRTVHGRAWLGALGLLGSVPFFITLFFLPLKGITIPTDSSLLRIIGAILISLITNGWVVLAFVIALIGSILVSADPPNWAALITDVNLPEHRGTVIGLTRLVRATGNAVSVGLTGLILAALTANFSPPANYAVGLALFQLLLIPAALCYYAVSQTVAQDIAAVRQTLAHRVTQLAG